MKGLAVAPVSPRPGGPAVFKKVAEIAAHYQVVRNTVYQWFREANPPPGRKGHWKRSEIDKWLESRPKWKRQVQEPARESLQMREAKAKVRKLEAAAKRAEQQAREGDKQFVTVLVVNQFLGEFFSTLRRNAQAIPADMAAAYPEEWRDRVRGDLTNRMELLLNQMADFAEVFEPPKEEGSTGEEEEDSED